MAAAWPFDASTLLSDKDVPTLDEDATSMLSYLRADMIKKVKNARKMPSVKFSVAPIINNIVE